MKWETVKGTSTTYKTELMYGVYWRTYQAQTDAGNWIEIAKGESRYVEQASSSSSSSGGLLMAPKDDALYNCHGFTFGGTSVGGGPYSILDGRAVTTLLADEHTEIENPVVGCTVVFGGDAHSGIVVGIDSGEAPLKKRVNVRSKLGTKNVISTETIEALDRFGKAKFYLRKTAGGSGGGSSSSSGSGSGLPPVLPISVLGIEDLPPLIVAPRRGTVFEHPGNYAIERGLATAPSFNSEPISQGERNRMLLDLPYKARVL